MTNSKETPAPAIYAEGQEVEVKFTAFIVSGEPEIRKMGTTEVRERGNGKIHYLYLGSGNIGLPGRSKIAGDRLISVDFSGIVKNAHSGLVRDNYAYTDGTGFSHFLDLSSPSITPRPVLVPDGTASAGSRKEQVTNSADGTVAVIVTSAPQSPSGISTADRISSLAVLARIAELEDGPKVTVERTVSRTGQEKILGRFATLQEGEDFLDRNDYRRARFYVLENSDADRKNEELKRLMTLEKRAVEAVGLSRWADGVTLTDKDLLGPDWARSEAMTATGVSSLALIQWPMNLINWTAAANIRREMRFYIINDGVRNWFLEI